MLGRKELEQLDLAKQALVAESGLNRLAVKAELQNLHSATSWICLLYTSDAADE